MVKLWWNCGGTGIETLGGTVVDHGHWIMGGTVKEVWWSCGETVVQWWCQSATVVERCHRPKSGAIVLKAVL